MGHHCRNLTVIVLWSFKQTVRRNISFSRRDEPSFHSRNQCFRLLPPAGSCDIQHNQNLFWGLEAEKLKTSQVQKVQIMCTANSELLLLRLNLLEWPKTFFSNERTNGREYSTFCATVAPFLLDRDWADLEKSFYGELRIYTKLGFARCTRAGLD